MNAVTVFAISVGALCAAAGLAADPNVPPGRRLSDPIEQERAESEEQYVLLNARVQNLLETQDLLLRHQALLLQNLEELEKKLEQVEAAQREALANFVTRAELKHLVEKLEEIDQKRLADNDLVLDKIKELARTPPEVKVVVPAPAAIAAGSEKVQVYKVQPGDTLTRIVAAYNRDLGKSGLPAVTQEQVEKVNPDLNPDRIRVDQIIFLPVPAVK